MGTTIFYDGSLKAEDNIENINQYIISICDKNKWNYNLIKSETQNGISVKIDNTCEYLNIVFDANLNFKGFTKTAFSTFETHKEIIKIFYNIKKYFIKLSIYDESGYWDEYNDSFTKQVEINMIDLTLEQKQELELGFDFPPCNQEEKWFWEKDFGFSKKENCHLPTIRDLMRKDLTKILNNNIDFKSLENLAREKGVRIVRLDDSESAFITLTDIWTNCSTIDENKTGKNKGVSLSFVLAEACLGFYGGYIDSLNRQASKFYQTCSKTTNLNDPIETLKFFYSVLEFYNLKRIIV